MINLDALSLHVFKMVFETGCCTTVAKYYRIPNSKVTRCLHQFRDYYNDALFIRKKNGLVANDKARELYPHVCKAVEALTQLDNANQNPNGQPECKISVPATLSVGLPEYLENEVLNQFGDVSLSVKSDIENCCSKILEGDLCYAVSQVSVSIKKQLAEHSSLAAIEIGKGEFVNVVAREDHPIWSQQLTLENIAQYPFVATTLFGFNDQQDPFEAFCKDRELPKPLLSRTTNLASLISKLRSSNAISFIGTRCAGDFIDFARGVRAQLLPDSEYQRLHSIMPQPEYLLLYRHPFSNCCSEDVANSMCGFVSEQISLSSYQG